MAFIASVSLISEKHLIEVVMTDDEGLQHTINGKLDIRPNDDAFYLDISKLPGEVLKSPEFAGAMKAFFEKAVEVGDEALEEIAVRTGAGKQLQLEFSEQ
jgi:hypothetical protein